KVCVLSVEGYVGDHSVLTHPAGHVEPGETILQAAVRETREETAWSVTPQALLGVYYWPQTERGNCVLRCTFCAHANSQDAQQSLDDGIITTHWLSREQLQARNERLRSPLVLAAIDAWVAGVRLPLSSIHCIGHEPL